MGSWDIWAPWGSPFLGGGAAGMTKQVSFFFFSFPISHIFILSTSSSAQVGFLIDSKSRGGREAKEVKIQAGSVKASDHLEEMKWSRNTLFWKEEFPDSQLLNAQSQPPGESGLNGGAGEPYANLLIPNLRTQAKQMGDQYWPQGMQQSSPVCSAEAAQ